MGMDASEGTFSAERGREQPVLAEGRSVSSTPMGRGTGTRPGGSESQGGISNQGLPGQEAVKSGTGRMAARDESHLAKDSQMTTETLKQMLQSDPPPRTSPSPTTGRGTKPHQVFTPLAGAGLPVLGTPVRMEPRVEVSPQKARAKETGSPSAEGRTNEFSDLKDFLMSAPPSSKEAHSLAEAPDDRRGSANLGRKEFPKRDSSLADNTGGLKGLVSRVTWNKSPEKNGANGNRGSASDAAPLERHGSVSSPSKLGRKPDTTVINDKSHSGTGGVPSPSYGLFSSRDRHIVDEYIGPSTIGTDGKQWDRDGGLFQSLVEVGSLPGTGSTEESSILAPDTESHRSVNPEVYGPHATTRNGNGKSLTLTEGPHEMQVKEIPNGIERPRSQSIPLADVLQLQRGMTEAMSANECRTLVDELLRRYGAAQDVARSP